MSQPEAQPIDATRSYARRVGDQTRVVITLPDALRSQVGRGLTGRRVWLRLRHQVETGHDVVRAEATVTTVEGRPVLTVDVPSEQLGSSVWNLALRVGAGDAGTIVSLEARLLVSDTQPIALIAGPRPTTKMPEPAPR